MKVKLGNTWHDGSDEAVMVQLTEKDKNNIQNMKPGTTQYCDYPYRGLSNVSPLKKNKKHPDNNQAKLKIEKTLISGKAWYTILDWTNIHPMAELSYEYGASRPCFYASFDDNWLYVYSGNDSRQVERGTVCDHKEFSELVKTMRAAGKLLTEINRKQRKKEKEEKSKRKEEKTSKFWVSI